jgi:hypothetical protein
MSVWWQPICRSAATRSSRVIGCGLDHGLPSPCGGVTSATYDSPVLRMTIGTAAEVTPGPFAARFRSKGQARIGTQSKRCSS